MLKNFPGKKNIFIGVAVAALAAGSTGYYYLYGPGHRQAPTANEHSGHQAAGSAPAVGAETVKLDAKARQLAGVQTAQVVAKSLVKEVKTTGKIALNESSRAYITSRVEGRVDETYITAEGDYIAPGQAIAAVYSPTYIAAQEEYLLILDGVHKLHGAGQNVVQVNNRLLDASRRKLQLLGIPDSEIAHLEHTRQAKTHMTIRAQFGGTVMEKGLLPGAYIMPGEKLYVLSDLSTVWMYADLYEKDLADIRVGQGVVVTSGAYPGQSFRGQVSFINPVLDDASRTVKVRVSMDNPEGKLKPNLFVNAALELPLANSLVIPSSSLLDTGTRKVVYVAQGDDTFVKRDITIGQETDGYIQVLSGLQAGEHVVTAATFLIDSQTQLGQFGSHAGHGASKGGGATPPTSGSPPPAAAPTAAPPATSPTPAAPPASGSGQSHTGH